MVATKCDFNTQYLLIIVLYAIVVQILENGHGWYEKISNKAREVMFILVCNSIMIYCLDIIFKF